MIYTDGVHIAGETLPELHAFAAKAGIKRCWFHPHRSHPHFDKPKRYDLALLLGFGAELRGPRAVLELAKGSAMPSLASADSRVQVKDRALRGLDRDKSCGANWLLLKRHVR